MYPVINEVILKVPSIIVSAYWSHCKIGISSKTWVKVKEEENNWWAWKKIHIKRHWKIRNGFRLWIAWWWAIPSNVRYIHLNAGMDKDNVEKLVRTRIQKHKVNPTAVDDELDQNAFNPMNFIIE